MEINGIPLKKVLKQLGKQAKAARKAAKKSLAQTARESGMTIKQVINAEKGKF